MGARKQPLCLKNKKSTANLKLMKKTIVEIGAILAS